MNTTEELALPGCLALFATPHTDKRGIFVKSFQATRFSELGLQAEWKEQFFSSSTRGVIRGLHFQLPPAAQNKLVLCVHGTVLDVLVDLRRGSPTFKQFTTITLTEGSGTCLYLPVGIAHGFASLSKGAVVSYSVTAEHDPAQDAGIRWDSLPVPWPFTNPIISPRDRALPSMRDFESPFVFKQ